MIRLSSKLSQLGARVEVVVVGSGYGGGIAAARLARAGRQVAVLERGKEYLPGDFPSSELAFAQESQATIPGAPKERVGSPLGLFDFHVEKELNVLRGCGLGGTSLINASVALEADRRVFQDPRWPRELAEDLGSIDEGYRRAREVLRPREYPEDWPKLAKLDAHRRSGEVLGERWSKVPINVSFEDETNAFGSEESKCTLCGDCVSGCNYGAKKTVVGTYLRDAWNHGAQIFTEVSVDRIEAREDGLWAVHYSPVDVGREHFDGDAEPVLIAQIVVLGAGALGSSEILLRSRAAGLPLSGRLGESFSGNADVLAFGYNNDRRIDGVGAGSREPRKEHPVGPTITSAIDGRSPERPLEEHFMLQEGALPGAIEAIYPGALEFAAKKWGTQTDSGFVDGVQERTRILRSRLPGGAQAGAVANTQTYLGMGMDSGTGSLRLDGGGRLRLDWPGVEGEPAIETLNARLTEATGALGGTYVPNPLWSNHLESALVSVHPLGGCAMASDATGGVTNHKGQVFSGEAGAAVHEGLYVADGSVLPTPIGVNPLLTISAVAERSMALLAKDRGWTIEYGLDHRPPGPPREPEPPPGIGVRFTERMAGFLALGEAADGGSGREAYGRSYDAGEAAGSSCAFVLTLSTASLDATLDDPKKAMDISGTVEAPALSSEPLQVSDGQFALLSDDPDNLDTTNMIYAMTLNASDARRWRFRGVKTVHDDRGLDLWSDTTTLLVDLRDEAGALAGRGKLHISLGDFTKQLRTIGVSGAQSKLESVSAQVRFGRFFAGSLFDTYADVFARPSVFDPDAPPRVRRPLRVDPPEIHYFYTSDDVQLCLTRHRGGDKGPVVLAHGLGVSSAIFTVDTIDTNLVEYLFAHGYDVWLFDYRASIELPSSLEGASVDRMASIDFPEGVAEVRRLTGAESVQMVVHCIGATVFYASMLSGALKGVRAAVSSQATPHTDGSRGSRIKSGVHLPEVLDRLGFKSLTAYTDTHDGWLDRIYNRALELYPIAREERCTSAACHRITFLYTPLYEHDQLNVATHDSLHELFGAANVECFEQMGAIIRAEQLVDAEGRDVYLPHVERLAIPLRMIHGAENACYLPTGSERSYAWLQAHNDPSLYSRVLIPEHGHIDCIFGERAATAVYPHILEHLEANL